MPGDRPVSARLRPHPLSRIRHPALGAAGGARQRPQGAHGCADARVRRARAGYDWGGRAACVVAAPWAGRARALVSANGYNIHDIAGSTKPASAKQEHRLWYQYYFHTRRGRAGLEANRRDISRLLWQWSPNWRFDEMQQKAPENRDFFVFCYHFAT